MLLSAGRQSRNASGRITRKNAFTRLRPSAVAASRVLRGTASIPARKISMLKAPATAERPMQAQTKLFSSGIGRPSGPTIDSTLPSAKKKK